MCRGYTCMKKWFGKFGANALSAICCSCYFYLYPKTFQQKQYMPCNAHIVWHTPWGTFHANQINYKKKQLHLNLEVSTCKVRIRIPITILSGVDRLYRWQKQTKCTTCATLPHAYLINILYIIFVCVRWNEWITNQKHLVVVFYGEISIANTLPRQPYAVKTPASCGTAWNDVCTAKKICKNMQ